MSKVEERPHAINIIFGTVAAIAALVSIYATYKKDIAPAPKQSQTPAVQTLPVAAKPAKMPATETSAEMKDAVPMQPYHSPKPPDPKPPAQPPSFAFRSGDLTESIDSYGRHIKELDVQIINTSKEVCPLLFVLVPPLTPLNNAALNIKPGDTVHFKFRSLTDWTPDTDVQGEISFQDADRHYHRASFCMHGTTFTPCEAPRQ